MQSLFVLKSDIVQVSEAAKEVILASNPDTSETYVAIKSQESLHSRIYRVSHRVC